MKTRAFLIATLISAILQSLYYMIVAGITFLFLPNVLETFVQDIPSSGAPPPGFFNFMGVSLLVAGLGFVLALLAHTGTGILYAWLHRREESPVTAEQGAIGGAVAAFTARFLAGLLAAVGSLLLSNLMMSSLTNAGIPELTMPTNMPPMFFVVNSMSSVVGGLFSACFGAIVAAGLGALGGAISGALFK